MRLPRPLTKAEKSHVHPHMREGADAGVFWRLPHRPNTAIMDLSFVPPLRPQAHEPIAQVYANAKPPRRCPDCDGLLPARVRYCEGCRRKRARASRREYMQRKREKHASDSWVRIGYGAVDS